MSKKTRGKLSRIPIKCQYHASESVYTWRTRFRPDLVKPKNAELSKADIQANASWYEPVNSDILFQTVRNDLNTGGTIRYGIVDVLMKKAYKPFHMEVINQALTWVQTRWNMDVGEPHATWLCQAVYNTRSPQLAIEFLSVPWMRVFPAASGWQHLLDCVAEMAEERIQLRAAPERKPRFEEGEYIRPEFLKDEEATADETIAERINIVEFGHQIIQLFSNPRFGNVPNAAQVTALLRFYSAIGEVERASSAAAVLIQMDPYRRKDATSRVALAELIANRPKEALKRVKENDLHNNLARMVVIHAAIETNDMALAKLYLSGTEKEWILGAHLGQTSVAKGIQAAVAELKEAGKRSPDLEKATQNTESVEALHAVYFPPPNPPNPENKKVKRVYADVEDQLMNSPDRPVIW